MTLACLVAWASGVSVARATPEYDPLKQRLRGFSGEELQRLEPALERGPVTLVEFADTEADELPAVHLAGYVEAPADKLAGLIARPEHYSRFMRTIDDVAVQGRHGRSTVYSWKWRMALFTLKGRNMMTVYPPPPPERREMGHRISLKSTGGDLGQGRVFFRVIPRGPQRSLFILSMRIDLRDANYVMKQLSSAARSINRSANLALAYSMWLSLRKQVQTQKPSELPRQASLQRPRVDVQHMLPLLARGDLVLLSMTADRIDRIAVLGRLGHPPAEVRRTLSDAEAFGQALLPGSHAEVLEQSGPVTSFEWGIDLPLVGVSGRMRMKETPKAIHFDAAEGAFAGGAWRFEPLPVGGGSVILGWARFDLQRSAWLMKRLVSSDPYMSHGLSAASQVMLVRAIRSRMRDEN